MKNTWFVQDGDRMIIGHTTEKEALKEYKARLGEGYDQLELCEETDSGTRVREREESAE